MNERKGIAVAGNMIVDISYPVDRIPKSGELVPILGEAVRTVGGSVPNVGVDLAALCPELPVWACGRLGRDAEGELVREYLGRYPNIDRSQIRDGSATSFTLVMNETESRQRTFFTYSGAGADFCEEDIDLDGIGAEILHVAYILLLPALDREDAECGTKMARLLAHAKERGIKTSVDVVSESGDRFRRLVPPALRYTDYCIINELEAEGSTGVTLRGKDGALLPEQMEEALDALFSLGVSTWAVIHCPEGAWGKEKGGALVFEPSIPLPAGYIKGKVGAGDAFCAGVLLGAARKLSLAESIHLGSAAAVISMREPGATEGMADLPAVMSLYRELEEAAK